MRKEFTVQSGMFIAVALAFVIPFSVRFGTTLTSEHHVRVRIVDYG